MSPTNVRRMLALLGIILLATAGRSLPNQPTSSATALGPVRWLAKAGNPATDFVLENLNGERVESSQFRGHPILIHFWASWCQPCREESRRIEAAGRASRSAGLVILAVTNETDRGEIARFAREQNLSFPILFDPDSVVFDQYRVIGIPTSYFVDTSGVIRTIVTGPMTASDLERDIAKILKAADSAGDSNED